MDSLRNATVENNSLLWHLDIDAITVRPRANMIVRVFYQAMLGAGFFGNVLAIVVHANRLKTSTMVYMFSLAFVDATVCMVGVASPHLGRLGIIVGKATLYIVHVAAIFSMTMLAYIAMERCVAVLRPHTFSLSTGRAVVAVIVIFVFAVVYGAAALASREFGVWAIRSVLQAFIVTATLFVTVVCYVIVATILLRRTGERIRALRRGRPATKDSRATPLTKLTTLTARVTPVNMTTSVHHPPTSHSHSLTHSHSNAHSAHSSHVLSAGGTDIKAAQIVMVKKKAQGTLALLFAITAAYIMCWGPFWLYSVGVPMDMQLRRMYFIYPVANPFIYCCMSSMFRDLVKEFYQNTRTKMTRCCR